MPETKLDFSRARIIYSYKWSLSNNKMFQLNNQMWFIYCSTLETTVAVFFVKLKPTKGPTAFTVNPSSIEPTNIAIVSILNDKNEKIEEYSMSFKIPPASEDFKIECFTFTNKTDFKDLLVNNRLNISFELVEISHDTNNDQKCDKLEEMFLESKFSDVKFLAKNGKELAAHKIILASRVPYFEKMFQSNLMESASNTVKMADIEFNVLKEFLRFIYTEKVEHMEDVVNDLIIAADKYLMEDLKNHCEKYLRDRMCVENALDMLELAEKCNANELKTHLIEFVTDNLGEITQSNRFCEITAGDNKCAILGSILLALSKKNT